MYIDILAEDNLFDSDCIYIYIYIYELVWVYEIQECSMSYRQSEMYIYIYIYEQVGIMLANQRVCFMKFCVFVNQSECVKLTTRKQKD